MTYPVAPLGVRMRAVLTTFDASADPTTWTWTDITSRVHHMTEIVDDIGAVDDASETNTSLTFTLKNDDGWATTDNPASSAWPYFDIGCPLEYSLDVGDGGGWDVQCVAFITDVTIENTSGTEYRCLAHVTAAGVFARGNTAQDPPIYSALRRTTMDTRRKALWAFEDEQGTQQPASALPGGAPFVPYGGHKAFSMGQQSLVPGAAAMASIGTDQAMISWLPTNTGATSVRLSCVFYASQAPAGNVDLLALWNGRGGGTNRYVLELAPAGLRMRAYNASGTEFSGAGTIGFTSHLDGPVWLDLDLTQNGANIDYAIQETAWSIDPNTGLASNAAGFGSGSFAGTLGQIAAVAIAEFGDVSDVLMTMVSLTEPPFPSRGGFAAVVGWAGNTAAQRVAGMSGEFSLPFTVANTALGVVMGPQLNDSYEQNMRDVAKTDHGVLSDHKGTTSYRTSAELYNLAPAITLTRSGVRGQLPKDFGSVRSQEGKANRVTLQRPGGSSVTIENQLDQLAHGVYEREPDSANLASDYQLAGAAGWYLARGLATGARFDAFTINMRVASEYTPTLPGLVAALQLGDRISVTSPPPQYVQNPIERQVRGRTQTVLNRGYGKWEVAYSVVPTDAYDVFQLDVHRLDTSGTETIAAATSSATKVVAATANTYTALPAVGSGLSLPLWCAGEKVTLTQVATETALETFSGALANTWGSFPATVNLLAAAYGLNGTASNFQRTGTAGTISVPGAGQALYAVLAPYAMTDFDMTAYCSVPVLATGGPLEIEMTWRRQSNATAYALRLNINPSAAVTAQLYSPGNPTPVAEVDTGLTHTAGATYGMTVRTNGTTHHAYVWQGTTTAGRPPNPLIDVRDVERITPGYCSFRNGRSTSNTNAGAVTFTWTNIAFSNLQAFTLTRSQNGVVKALPAGSKIRLWTSRGMAV